MAQEFTIKSKDIEDKINQLLPSQGGFQPGVDFSASTMVIPIVDLTETAEGSNVREDLQTGDQVVVVKSAGTVDYAKGEVILTTINIKETERINSIIEIQAVPESNDVIGLKDLYLNFDISNSTINMVKDTITSGEQISGVGYKVTSSYTNGDLIRE